MTSRSRREGLGRRAAGEPAAKALAQGERDQPALVQRRQRGGDDAGIAAGREVVARRRRIAGLGHPAAPAGRARRRLRGGLPQRGVGEAQRHALPDAGGIALQAHRREEEDAERSFLGKRPAHGRAQAMRLEAERARQDGIGGCAPAVVEQREEAAQSGQRRSSAPLRRRVAPGRDRGPGEQSRPERVVRRDLKAVGEDPQRQRRLDQQQGRRRMQAGDAGVAAEVEACAMSQALPGGLDLVRPRRPPLDRAGRALPRAVRTLPRGGRGLSRRWRRCA